MRKAFNHYRNIYDIKKQLSDKQYLLFDKALCGVQFLEKHIESIAFEDAILTLLWTSIKHTLKSNVEGYCNKMQIDYESLFDGHTNTTLLGGYEGGTQGGSQQGEEKEEGKGKEQKVKPTLLSKYIDSKKKCSDSEIAIVEDFINYRKEIKKPLKTITPLKTYINVLTELHNLGYKYKDCIDTMKSSEWQSLKVDYIHKGDSANNRSGQKTGTDLAVAEAEARIRLANGS